MTPTAQATPPAGDGAPLEDIALVGGIISVATIAMLTIVVLHRADRLPGAVEADAVSRRFLGLPLWASVPGIGAIGAGVVAFMGAIWDIGVHIDQGRDEGPFGTTAHYPFLVGLVFTYLFGVLALGMTPRDEERTSASGVRLAGVGKVPVGALLILAGGGYAMLGFPLDDLWHRVFGQDVTLWGPTHTMFFGGLITATCGAVLLLAEGARSLGHEPFGAARAAWHRPLAGVLGGIFLFVGTHATDEFNWAVPQYRQVWQPLLLLFFGAVALVLARRLGGRGGTIGALLAYLPLQGVEVLLIGGLGTTQPASVLYLAEAAIVELVFWRVATERGRGRGDLRAAVLAGGLLGTVGFAAEHAWSQVAFPLPWPAAFLPEAVPMAVGGAIAGAVLAVLLSRALLGELGTVTRPLLTALAAAGLAVALAVNAGIATTPETTATMALTDPRTADVAGGGEVRVADLVVRFDRTGLGEDANWAYVLGWQGGGRFTADLERQADGSFRSSAPVPVSGPWKTYVRVQDGRAKLVAPVYMPADAELDFAGYPARPEVARAMGADSTFLQVERKEDGPTWAWLPAMLLVQALNLSLMALIGAGAVRAGRGARHDGPQGPSAPGATSPRRDARPRPTLAPTGARA